MLDEKTIQTAVQRIVAAAHSPVKVILFGSYARGDADEGSDLDLIVVEKEIPDYTDEYLHLRNTLGPLGVGVDLLLYQESEFEKRREWYTTPVYWALREGKVLYDAAA